MNKSDPKGSQTKNKLDTNSEVRSFHRLLRSSPFQHDVRILADKETANLKFLFYFSELI